MSEAPDMSDAPTEDGHALALASRNHEHGDFWTATPLTNESYDAAPNHGMCACGRFAVAEGIHWHLGGKCHTREKCDE
jgi:hypothetical protein